MNMVSGAEDDPRWAIVNMVSGAEYGPSVTVC